MPRREILLVLQSIKDETVIRSFLMRQEYAGISELLIYLEHVDDATYDRWISQFNSVMAKVGGSVESKETSTAG